MKRFIDKHSERPIAAMETAVEITQSIHEKIFDLKMRSKYNDDMAKRQLTHIASLVTRKGDGIRHNRRRLIKAKAELLCMRAPNLSQTQYVRTTMVSDLVSEPLKLLAVTS